MLPHKLPPGGNHNGQANTTIIGSLCPFLGACALFGVGRAWTRAGDVFERHIGESISYAPPRPVAFHQTHGF